MNTGFEPYSQGPVYVDYSRSGAGTTVFDYSPREVALLQPASTR
jgi:hypothetical protein